MAMSRTSIARRAACAGVAGLAGLGLSLTTSAFVSPTSLQAAPGTVRHASFNDARWGDTLADALARNLAGHNDAGADPGSLYTVERAIGARSVWQQRDSANRQITGQGVTVALLDSGTAPVAGLDAPGKLAYGPDLSIESNGVLTDQDTFGHGTHLAGIIAGRDAAALTDRTIAGLSPAVQLGVAPDARLLSLKLATTDGSTDVSQVIAALNWITEHQSQLDGSRVRVVNLSFGTDSMQPYQLDPLAAAAENAWRHGIVVVVSGGNDGPQRRPADRPGHRPVRDRGRRLRRQRHPARLGELAGRRLVLQRRHPAAATSTCWRPAPRSSRCATRAPSSTPTTRRAGSPATAPAGCSAAAAPARPQRWSPARSPCCCRPTPPDPGPGQGRAGHPAAPRVNARRVRRRRRAQRAGGADLAGKLPQAAVQPARRPGRAAASPRASRSRPGRARWTPPAAATIWSTPTASR